MTTLYGQVITSGLYIRATMDTSKTPLGRLDYGDLVEAVGRVGGWWELTKITRAGQNIPLPVTTQSPKCYSYEGLTQSYIKEVTPPPFPTPVPDPTPLPIQAIVMTIDAGADFVVDVAGAGTSTVVLTIRPK